MTQYGTRLEFLTEELIATALADLERLEKLEREFVPKRTTPAESELELRRLVWRLFNDWADDAEQLWNRVKALKKSSVSYNGAERLEEAIGKTKARLNVTPEQLSAAVAQARDGQFVPAKELRDELRSRVRVLIDHQRYRVVAVGVGAATTKGDD
jgi:hypothetical protein